ncbi:TetR/AcrR family transcriptional regulator [Nocardioides luteus]|uniref:TetR/AcrR family transcriptional regulator n=1 Tax=Nocardioides luteus TaxID=1844 RepID=UPI0018C92DCF|nr:TetR/AcrR family transcriptional regulator [Nocardioides luteus]MBG6095784.1 TetR/AcrR family transcriptional repressor of nem operon [Nocardioides luteus]
MGRTSDARERLVAAGTELFSERAYSSVGVAELAARAGVQKGSFYYFFPSKEALALAVIDAHWVWQRGEWSAILARPGTALERLRGIFDATAEMQTSALRGSGAVTGCLFGNLALEVSSMNPSIQKRLQEIFEEQVQIIAEHLTAAVDDGEIELVDPRLAAKSIVAQLEGLVLFAKLFNDPSELDALWGNSLRLIGIASPAGQSAAL